MSCLRIFPVPAHPCSRAKSLITQPYRNWKDAREDLNHHAELQYHKGSMEKLNSFISCCKISDARIERPISKSSTRLVGRNRKYLSATIPAIAYYGCQGIALRGHCDDGSLINDEESNVNCGNFKELIKVMSGFDSELKEHMLSCKGNITYLSKTTQNDTLLCIKESIQQEIVKEFKDQKEGPYSGLSTDEFTDASNWEQLGVIVF